jgi:hypothetical protein
MKEAAPRKWIARRHRLRTSALGVGAFMVGTNPGGWTAAELASEAEAQCLGRPIVAGKGGIACYDLRQL